MTGQTKDLDKDRDDIEARIGALPIWSGPISVEPLPGGITNRNFLVTDRVKAAVVRFGGDLPVHGVMRFNEQAASRAAGEAGLAPKVLFAAPATLVLDYVPSRAYAPEDVRANLEACVALVKRAHREVARHLRGPTLAFNVFHIVRNYAHALVAEGGAFAKETPRLLAASDMLEAALGPIDFVFGHNDLLAANFLDDGERLWLIDWEYAGWGSALFDLGGLAANNSLSTKEQEAMLEIYFGREVDDALRYRLQAMSTASNLRETMWSMSQESRSVIDFDYAAYTLENLRRFEAAFAQFKEMKGR